MADTQLTIDGVTTGWTVYAIVKDEARRAYNGSAFATFVPASWPAFATPAPETPAGSTEYVAQFPLGSPAGNYTWSFYLQVGGSPASTDPRVGGGGDYWDGTTFGLGTLLTGSVDLSIAGTVDDAAPRAYAFSGSAGLSGLDNFYAQNGLALCFTSGALKGLKATIAGYQGASRKFTFLAPFPQAPADGDGFSII